MTRGFLILPSLLAMVIAMPSGCITSDDGPTVFLNGKSVPNPATIEALGEGYSFDYPTLYYNGEASAGVIFDENSEQDDELKKEIKWLINSSQSGTPDDALSVDGIILGSEQSEVLKTFGEPSDREDDLKMWVYREDGQPEDESWLVFEFTENDRVSWIGMWINR